MHRFLFILILSVAALRAEAATMARVVRVESNATMVVVRDGVEINVKLAGIDITDTRRAQEVLRWSFGATVTASWVMLEPRTESGPDAFFVYRTPDALFLNRELVARGCARATLPGVEAASHTAVTYLGELNLPAVTKAPARQTGTGKSRTSKSSPSRRAKAPRPRSSSAGGARP
jgi:hypothetical protein